MAGLLVAACGGPATPGVASLQGNAPSQPHTPTPSSSGTSTGGTKGHAVVAFARCMRKHGVKSFPENGGTTVQIGSGSGIDPNSPIFQAAQKACQSYLPKPSPAQLHKLEANALRFSECMRKHGLTNFPDPQFSTSGGGLGIRIGGPNGSLDPSSPAFQAAQKACQKDLGLKKGTHPGAVRAFGN